MSCDIRLAASHAGFGAQEIKLGWIGGGGMSYLLAHSIGPSNAALMLMTVIRSTPHRRFHGDW